MPEARADLQTVAARLAGAYPATNRNVGVLLRPLREELVGTLRPAVLSLLGAVLLVLLIACANVANLLMVRATAQRREIAIRKALGAGRMQFFSQFLAQALVLCLLGGALGMVLAAGVLPLLRMALAHTASLDPSMIQSIGLNVPVLLFALFTCMLVAILFSLFPLISNSPHLTETLRAGERGSTGSRTRGRGALVAGEIAIAVVVLFLSTLVMRSFQKLLAVDPGFRIRHRTLAGITRNTVSLCYRCEPTGLGNAIGISGLPKWGRCTQVASSPPGSPASDVCSLRWKQKSHCWSSATAC
jgi:predicted lysophospholipase L1 biosynthesis ABC-type transport system permease subunit